MRARAGFGRPPGVQARTFAERLGIAPVDLEELLSKHIPWNLSQMLAVALLEAGAPRPIEEVAWRLEQLGVKSRIGNLATSLTRSWRGRRPVMRTKDGRVTLDLDPSEELSKILWSIGEKEASLRSRPRPPVFHPPEGMTGPFSPALVLRPLFKRRELLALAGLWSFEGAEPWVLYGKGFEAEARRHVAGAKLVVGLELRPLLDALDLPRQERFVRELKLPTGEYAHSRSSSARRVILYRLLGWSATGSRPLNSPQHLEYLHALGPSRHLGETLAADVRTLRAAYDYAVLHGGYRFRSPRGDRILPVRGLTEPGMRPLASLLREAHGDGSVVELRVGAKSADVVRGQVSALDPDEVTLDDGVDPISMRIPSVRGARVVGEDGVERRRAGAILPSLEIPSAKPIEPLTLVLSNGFGDGLETESADDPEAPPSLVLETSGHLRLEGHRDPALMDVFRRGESEGLWALLCAPEQARAAPSLGFGFQVAEDLLEALLELPEEKTGPAEVSSARPSQKTAALRLASAPPFPGSEGLDLEALDRIWGRLAEHLAERVAQHGFSSVLAEVGPSRHARGRVWLHLAENKEDEGHPFGFLATFTPLESPGRHIPLAEAFALHAGDRAALTQLLTPVDRAAAQSPWFQDLLSSRLLFEPLAWTAEEAFRFLEAAPELEGSGVRVRLPKKWQKQRKRPMVQIRVGEVSVGFGVRSLLNFDVNLTLDGSPLSEAELSSLLEGVPRLQLLRGEWVEVDPAALGATLEAWAKNDQAVPLAEGMKLLAEGERDGAEVVAGTWLRGVLDRLRAPGALEPSPGLKATLRPYQREGLAWLAVVTELGLGGCLADDMGLGKTLQVIALLLRRADAGAGPALVLVPASLIGNWKAELQRFAPSLRVGIMHRSEGSDAEQKALLAALDEHDVIISTYGSFARHEELLGQNWSVAVLDEAQAIKNPATAVSSTVRKLRAPARIALTGTPIENRLLDLWSLFSFLNPGLLGTEAEFQQWVESLSPPRGKGYRPLRQLIEPYLLRRLKTDRKIISDLPEKTELTARCPLSRRQAALYADAVKQLAKALQVAPKGKRAGILLIYLTRFKQICNHPSQWLQEGEYRPEDSGKMQILQKIARTVKASREKMLVFTQYKAMTQPLHDLLMAQFGAPGLILHGQVSAKDRTELVKRFQSDAGPSFFVLSLKAGGTGLNLTAASHVVHFDRWWNPAVESQATDRAFRIGQRKNVLVHRFMCAGTLEERIDALITAKRGLSEEVLSEGVGAALAGLSDEKLLDIVRLDPKRALFSEA